MGTVSRDLSNKSREMEKLLLWIRQFPKYSKITLDGLENLQELHLYSNKLTELPPEIGALQHLQVLNLLGNNLTELPPEIAALQNLQDLNLSSNKLTRLPPEIVALQNLKCLHLNRNNLTRLPPEIGKLQNLSWIGLSYNNLTELPPEIGALRLQYITPESESQYGRHRRTWCVLRLSRIRAGPDHKRTIWMLFQYFYQNRNKFSMSCLGQVLEISEKTWENLIADIGARLVIEHKIGGCAIF